MSNKNIKNILWWLCLFVAPLVLLSIELFHPAGFTEDPGMYEYLSKPHPAPYEHNHNALGYFGPQWWFTLHMIQTPTVGLVAIGLWLMLSDIDEKDGMWAMLSSWLSRIATYVFLIYYTVLDSIGGIGLGRTIEIVQQQSFKPEELEAVEKVLNLAWQDGWIGGVGSFVSQTGSWAIFFAALFAAITLFLTKKGPWPALLILIAFGWELQLSHASYHGPIAFALLIVASIWIWRHKQQMAQQAPI